MLVIDYNSLLRSNAMKPTKDQLDRAARYDNIEAAERYLKSYGVTVFGIEFVSVAGRELRYVNLGDTYDETVVEELGKLSVGSWGGWLEEAEGEYCADEGLIRCGHCGEFTPVDIDWRETVCYNCGNLVGG
jgi:hypothetical protein